jgi:predicted nucleic acid-binding protein
MSQLLDSCVLVDLLRGQLEADAFIAGLPSCPHISVITVTELRAGQRSLAEARMIDALVATYTVHDVTLDIAERAACWLKQFRRSHRLDIADTLIAATAATQGLPLATLNLKHFPMFPHLKAPY